MLTHIAERCHAPMYRFDMSPRRMVTAGRRSGAFRRFWRVSPSYGDGRTRRFGRGHRLAVSGTETAQIEAVGRRPPPPAGPSRGRRPASSGTLTGVRGGADVERGGGALAQIEYRLARERVVKEYRRGRLSRLDICDAQPELLRVARHLGKETAHDCPICEGAKLAHVTFAFGPRLPASGRAISSPAELAKLAHGPAAIACYVVEVCTACSWNHLVRMSVTGGRAEPAMRPPGPALP